MPPSPLRLLLPFLLLPVASSQRDHGIVDVPYADQALRPGQQMPHNAPLMPQSPPVVPDGFRFQYAGQGAGQGVGQGAEQGMATSVAMMTAAGQQQFYITETPHNTYGMMPGSGTGYNGPWVPPQGPGGMSNQAQGADTADMGAMGHPWITNALPPWAQKAQRQQQDQRQLPAAGGVVMGGLDVPGQAPLGPVEDEGVPPHLRLKVLVIHPLRSDSKEAKYWVVGV